MAKVQELEIRNKYTGELIRTVPADTPETVKEKIKKVHKNQHLLKEMDFFERAQLLAKFATKLRFNKAKLKKLVGWLWVTAFVGANLFQYGFSKFCPMAGILKKLGVPETRGSKSCCSN